MTVCNLTAFYHTLNVNPVGLIVVAFILLNMRNSCFFENGNIIRRIFLILRLTDFLRNLCEYIILLNYNL